MATAKYTQKARMGNTVVPIQRNEVWGEDKRWNVTKAVFAAFGAVSLLFGVLLFGAILALGGYWAFNHFSTSTVTAGSHPTRATPAAVVPPKPPPVVVRPVVVVAPPSSAAPPSVTVNIVQPLTLWQLDKQE